MCQIVISAPAILWLTNCVILNKSDKSCKNFENINTYIHEYINWRIDPCIAYMISLVFKSKPIHGWNKTMDFMIVILLLLQLRCCETTKNLDKEKLVLKNN